MPLLDRQHNPRSKAALTAKRMHTAGNNAGILRKRIISVQSSLNKGGKAFRNCSLLFSVSIAASFSSSASSSSDSSSGSSSNKEKELLSSGTSKFASILPKPPTDGMPVLTVSEENGEKL